MQIKSGIHACYILVPRSQTDLIIRTVLYLLFSVRIEIYLSWNGLKWAFGLGEVKSIFCRKCRITAKFVWWPSCLERLSWSAWEDALSDSIFVSIGQIGPDGLLKCCNFDPLVVIETWAYQFLFFSIWQFEAVVDKCGHFGKQLSPGNMLNWRMWRNKSEYCCKQK